MWPHTGLHPAWCITHILLTSHYADITLWHHDIRALLRLLTDSSSVADSLYSLSTLVDQGFGYVFSQPRFYFRYSSSGKSKLIKPICRSPDSNCWRMESYKMSVFIWPAVWKSAVSKLNKAPLENRDIQQQYTHFDLFFPRIWYG